MNAATIAPTSKRVNAAVDREPVPCEADRAMALRYRAHVRDGLWREVRGVGRQIAELAARPHDDFASLQRAVMRLGTLLVELEGLTPRARQ